jgi:hypothetical protein
MEAMAAVNRKPRVAFVTRLRLAARI